MFYEPGDGSGYKDAGFERNPYHALVVPRPIGWVSTLGADGVTNLAPFSYFNEVSPEPPMVMFAINGPHATEGGDKDSLKNVKETGEFVVNLCTEALARHMNASSTAAPRPVDEFGVAGLTKAPSRIVRAPRVAESPVHLECTVVRIVELPSLPRRRNTTVFGRVVGIHISDDLIVNGRVDILKVHPVGRLGYSDYAVITKTFEMLRPAWPLKGGA